MPDLRLAGFAVALWLAALAALYLSARTGLLVGAGFLAAAGVVGAAPALRRQLARFDANPARAGGLRRGDGRGRFGWGRFGGEGGEKDRAGWVGSVRWVALAMLLGAGCGSAVTGVRVSIREAAPLVAIVRAGDPVRVELVVRDDPRAVRGAPNSPPTYVVAVDLEEVRAEGTAPLRLSARALVLGSDSGWRGLLPGQRVKASGRLLPPQKGDLRAAVLSARAAPILVGRPSWTQRAAGALRAGLQRACAPLPDDAGGLLPGLVDGDTSRLDPALSDDFRTTGMTHLNAVSGSNVAIVLSVVLLAVRWTRAGPVVTAVIGGLALVGFVILARPSPSVIRAAAMGAIGLLGMASGRPRTALPALAAAVALLIVSDPELAADVGFTLSVTATGALLLLAPVWRDGLRKRGWPAWAAEALAVPAAAQVACGPVIAGISGTVSLVAVPANLVVVPAIAPATLLGIAAAVLSPIWATGAAFVAWLGYWPAKWLVMVATYGARVPAGALPWPDGPFGALLLAAITVVLLVAARRPIFRKLAAVVALCGMLGALPVRLLASGWPPKDWIVVVCAVGQGDAIVLPAGAGRAVVIDAGPEPNAVDHCLQRLGVKQVVIFIASHFHADHVGGVEGVFRGRKVLAVAGPDWPEPVAGRAEVVSTAAPLSLHVIEPGWTFAVSGLQLTAIGPFEPLHGTNSDPNNNSLVLRARLRDETVLLPGDAETEEQDELLSHLKPADLRADVLKVAHHGSAYQEPKFLDVVDPAIALVSVGKDNDYGHPNPALLARLARSGARVLRTDKSGDLAAVMNRGRLAVVARGSPP